jgi:hypothetical protein
VLFRSGTLTLNNGGSAIAFEVLTGTHTIAAPLTLQGNSTIAVAAGADLKLFGPVAAAGTVLTKAGLGKLEISEFSGLALNLQAGVTAALPADSLLDLTGLTVAAGASLDLLDTDMVLRYADASPYAAYSALIQSGRIATSLSHPTAGTTAVLALVDNQELHLAAWHGHTLTTGSDFGQLLFAYTYTGDTNLDGMVTGADLYNIIGNMGRTGLGWFDGDLTGDGLVSLADLNVVTTNLGSGVVGSPPLAALFGPIAATEVPEPACLGLLALSAAALLGRRRPSHRQRTPLPAPRQRGC